MPTKVSYITAPTAQFLIEQYPIDYVLLDVRRKDEIETFGAIEYSVNLPVTEWGTALTQSESEFSEKFHFAKPSKSDNLVIIGRSKNSKRALDAANIALSLGYTRVTIIEGGIEEYSKYDDRVSFYDFYSLSSPSPPPHPRVKLENIVNYPWITTEELHKASKDTFLIVDLRRKDEIANFGSYPNSVNLPTEECTRAIQLSEEEWKENFKFTKPLSLSSSSSSLPLLLYCRSNRRAKFVYNVLRDAGWEKEGINIKIFKDGVAGLSRIVSHVLSYDAYDPSDPLPPVIPPVDPLI